MTKINVWNKTEINVLRDGVRSGLSYPKIAKQLREMGFSRSSDSCRKYYTKHYGPKTHIKEKPKKLTNKQYDDAVSMITAFRDSRVRDTLQRFVTIGRPVESKLKVLTISDLHFPFHNPVVIDDAIEKHGDADILVINGDALDHYIFSTFIKDKDIPFEVEYRIAAKYLRLFAERFKKVIFVKGNHEDRMKRYFASNIHPAASEFVNDDALRMLADGYDYNSGGKFEKMYDLPNVEYDGGDLAHYTVVGKCIFVHPRTFSGVRGKTAIQSIDYFMDREDFHCIVMAHTHKMSSIIHRNKLVIEQGCCCIPMEYENNGKMSMQPQSFGYAVVYMDERGSVDFQRSRPIYVGTGTPIKEKIHNF